MATKKPAAKKPARRTSTKSTKLIVKKSSEARDFAESAADELVKTQFDSIVFEVEKKIKLIGASAVNSHRTSTGIACLDLALGGGLAPGFHQYSGPEASGKTTAGLSFLGSLLKKPGKYGGPSVQTVYWDAEGCLVETTNYRVNGKDVPLNDLFDLSTVDRSQGAHYPGPSTLIDTHSEDGSVLQREGRLYYGGDKSTTKVVMEDGTELVGARHPVFVLRADTVQEVMLEDLVPGDVLLVKI